MPGWMNAGRSNVPPVGIGEVMRAGAVGEVLASRHPGFEVGQHVVGMFGVQECAVSDGRGVLTVDPALPPLPTYLGSGEVPVRRRGARLRPAIDYKSADVRQALRPEAPDGVEVYFDNVGGDILDAVPGRLARGAQVVICGAIGQYNSEGAVAGPANYLADLHTEAGSLAQAGHDVDRGGDDHGAEQVGQQGLSQARCPESQARCPDVLSLQVGVRDLVGHPMVNAR